MKKRMKKKLALLIALAASVTLAACATAQQTTTEKDKVPDEGGMAESAQASKEPEADNEALTLEFFQQKAEEGPQKGYQAIIDAFHTENPDIKIEMNTVPDAGTVLTSRISSGDMPVIFSDYPTQQQFKQKVANGYVQNLSGQDFLKNINSPSLEMSKQEDGGYYAMPYSRNYMGVFYNKDIFKEYGVTAPETWGEFASICETLKNAGVMPMGLMGKDPGRVGHTFQCALAAWAPHGVETLEKAAQGNAKVEGDPEFIALFTKMAELLSESNDDALALSDTACWENFVNGNYAMCITGSYARGTLLASNPDIKLGVFPLPNDTLETTRVLSGIDAAICVSAKASDIEKEAAYRFLAYLAETKNAQIFCDNDGAPSCINGVASNDDGISPMLQLINSGQTQDWLASAINNNVVTDIYNVVQGFWADKDVEMVLKNIDASIAVTSAE